MATVDVIIPFYNAPLAFVEQALASLRAQTFTDWQACVVNDGSERNPLAGLGTAVSRAGRPADRVSTRAEWRCRRRAKRWLGRHEFAIYHTTGFRRRYLPHMLQAHIALFEGQPEVDVVYADHEGIDRNGSVTQSAAMLHAARVATKRMRSARRKYLRLWLSAISSRA